MGGSPDRALALELGWEELESQTVIDESPFLHEGTEAIDAAWAIEVDLSEFDGAFAGEPGSDGEVDGEGDDASRVRIRAYRDLVLPAGGRAVPPLPLIRRRPAVEIVHALSTAPPDTRPRSLFDEPPPNGLIDAWAEVRSTLRRRCTSLEQWGDAILDAVQARGRVSRATQRVLDLLAVIDRLSVNALSARAEGTPSAAFEVEMVVREAHAFVDLVLTEVEDFVATANDADAVWGTLSSSFAEHAATVLLAGVAPALLRLAEVCVPSDDASPVMLSVACEAEQVRGAAELVLKELRASADYFRG